MASMNRGEGKSFSPRANELVREGLRELVRRNDNNRTRTAKLLGVSQPAVSAILNGPNNASALLASRIARELGMSLAILTGGEVDDVIRWRSLPWWSKTLARAREMHPEVSDDAWDWLGSLAGADPPEEDPVALGAFAATWDQARLRARKARAPVASPGPTGTDNG